MSQAVMLEEGEFRHQSAARLSWTTAARRLCAMQLTLVNSPNPITRDRFTPRFAAKSSSPPRGSVLLALFDIGVQGQVGRKLGHKSGTTPSRSEATRVDGGDVTRTKHG